MSLGPDHHSTISGWHFSRKLLADSYLKTLSSGVMLSTTIHAPRQTGLTQFLINDVMPAAVAENYLPVYVDLSDTKVPVTAAVMWGLERVFAGTSIFKTGVNLFKNLFASHDLSISKKTAYISQTQVVDHDYFVEQKNQHFEFIEEKIERLIGKKSVLLIFDHAHNLLEVPLGLEFCKLLCKLISKHGYMIKPLYATNNVAQWEKIFKTKNSPLYSEGAFIHHLPKLGKNFVRDVVKQGGITISMEEANNGFEMTQFRPGIFVALIMRWENEVNIPFVKYCHQMMVAKEKALEPQSTRVN